MSSGSEFIKFCLAGVEERLNTAATEPIGKAVMLAMTVQPGRVRNVDAKIWFEKLSTLSRDSQHSGKRFRARLAIISCLMLSLPAQDAVHLGTFVEMIQAASLVHDDVVDEAKLRRGKLSLNAQMGNRFAVLTGDYIMAQAMSELSMLRSVDLLPAFAQVVSQMSFGEAMEIETTFTNRSVEHYLATISLKTASLMSFSCNAPCLLAKSDKLTTDALSNFGFNLGMTFQLIDDVLDFTGPDGKKIGQDSAQGILTLPLILLTDKKNLFKMSLDEVLSLIKTQKTLERSISLAIAYSKSALESLSSIKNSLSKDGFGMMLEITEGIFERLPEPLKNPQKEFEWKTI